ncbi:hypothetical protein HD806DRAFT_531109 [Xylariaceae sp. AK1471]|nr:hypothetical protein HD806DRAFT_531109 [Xylariaceae sp. AK1471]
MSGNQQQNTGSPKVKGLKHSATGTNTDTSSSSMTFTPEMRSRQARGKNPYYSDSEDSDWTQGQEQGSGSGSGSPGTVGPNRICAPKREEPFAVYERRRMAAQILDSPELLMMAAVRDDESIPATRLKYTRVLCGLEEPNSISARTGSGPARSRSSTSEKQRKRSNQGQRSVSGRAGGR